MNAAPPPGWYNDHTGSGLRYWDGQKWTEHTAPAATTPPPAGHLARPGATPVGGAPVTSQRNWFLRHKIHSGVFAFVFVLFAVGLVGGLGGGPAPATSDDTTEAVSNPGGAASAASQPEIDPQPVDTDGDGVSDGDDFRPKDAKVQTRDDIDTDRDGVSDGDDFRPKDAKVQTRDDIDTDQDGVADYRDDFPKDAKYSLDTDGDRVPNQLDDFPKDAKYSQDSDGDGAADSQDAFPADPSRSKITLAMQNALSSAQDYLQYTAFSRQGLIDQLSSKYGAGFHVDDATWAVDQLKVDWKQQAVRSAKDYLDYTSFSRQGLIDQLSSPYGAQFTLEEATYAVNKIGL